MPLLVGQPVVRFVNAVAAFAAAQAVVKLGRQPALHAGTFGELVERPLQIVAKIKAARVKEEMLRLVVRLVVNGIVEGVMAVGAFKDPLGVNVPRTAERPFIRQI